ncbi:NADP oxidoreductase [Roseiarcus sp.]|uniref:NADH-quinone oxidoreductase subunit B family protein n=1 Tax=Roseiarcus sp. TaxID=1969460 RepID=UPI003F9456FE
MRKARVATTWLDGCSGCHMSLLDIDEAIVAVAHQADVVYGPLVDAQEVPPDIDVAIVEGAVSSEDDLRKIRAIRRNARILVALGDCAVTGNVPMMRNPLPVKAILERLYVEGADVGKGVPNEVVPPLLKQVAPLHDVVKVDLHVPGCPPSARLILFVLKELLEGRVPDLKSSARFG